MRRRTAPRRPQSGRPERRRPQSRRPESRRPESRRPEPPGRLAGIAVLLALLGAAAGCDPITFVAIEDPPPHEPRGHIRISYAHVDSLRAWLRVDLLSWIPEPYRAGDVRVDGVPLPPDTSSQPHFRLLHDWVVPTEAHAALPQLLEIPPAAGQAAAPDLQLRMPVLLRQGPDTVCARGDEVVLPYRTLALPDTDVRWFLRVQTPTASLSIDGSTLPPEPFRLSLQSLGEIQEPAAADLILFFQDSLSDAPPLTLSVDLRARWTLTTDPDHAACAAPS